MRFHLTCKLACKIPNKHPSACMIDVSSDTSGLLLLGHITGTDVGKTDAQPLCMEQGSFDKLSRQTR